MDMDIEFKDQVSKLVKLGRYEEAIEMLETKCAEPDDDEDEDEEWEDGEEDDDDDEPDFDDPDEDY